MNFLNVYGPGLAILFVVFVEAAGVFWFYGVDRFSSDVEMMLGKRPGLFWRICWTYISPVFLLVIDNHLTLFTLTDFNGKFSLALSLPFRPFLFSHFWAMKKCSAPNTNIRNGASKSAGRLHVPRSCVYPCI